jgi:small ligand-binding sensory domain FIST
MGRRLTYAARVMQQGLGFSSAIRGEAAAREAVVAARVSLGTAPEHALVFATGAFGLAIDDVLDAVEAELGGVPVHGGLFSGVFAAGGAAVENPGLAVALLAGAELHAVLLDELPIDDPHAAEEVHDHLGVALGERDLLFVAADFAHHDASAFFASLAKHAGEGVRALGAGCVAAGEGASMVWSHGRRSAGGVLALAIRAGAAPDVSLVARCRPIDEPRVVSRARGNWVSGIGEADAVDVLRAAARGAHLAETPDSLRRLVMEVAHPGGSALCPIAGVDFDRGAVLIPGAVAAGDRVRVAVLDVVASRENLERLGANRGEAPAGLGLYLSGTGSDPAAAGEFEREARWFAKRGAVGIATAWIFGPTRVLGGSSQPLPACSLLASMAD